MTDQVRSVDIFTFKSKAKLNVTTAWSPVLFERTEGSAPIVLVCEHASRFIPHDFGDMGLSDTVRDSHVAWDIGALDVARQLSTLMDAPLVSCGVSRLLYDCNRPLSARDCIPSKSEVFDVPGNVGLSDAQRRSRHQLIHEPFHMAVDGLVRGQMGKLGRDVVVVTIHSFTPVYFGKTRDVEIGFLHHDNASLSLAAQRIEERRGRYRTALNQPYDASDGVTYSLAKHADAHGLHSTMVEIRNDLVDTSSKAGSVAVHLAETLMQSVAELAPMTKAAS